MQLRTTVVSVFAALLLIKQPTADAQQQINLGPLANGAQVPEFIVPGSGQGFAAIATYWLGRPVIFYDNVWVNWMGGVQSPAFRFTRAHEYMHHLRNHNLIKLTSPPQMLPLLTYKEELDADCQAVRYLKQIGDLSAVQAGYQIYRQVLPPMDAGGRPGAVARINNMNSC